MNNVFTKKGLLCTAIIICVIYIISLFMDLQNKETLLNNIKNEIASAVDSKTECSYYDEKITTITNKYNTLSNTYIELKRQLDLTNADKSDILLNKKAYSNGSLTIGSMPNNGELLSTINAGTSYSIKQGYTSGGKITAATLASQTVATAQAKNIIDGYTAWVNGVKLSGTNKGYDVGYTDGKSAGYNEGYTNGKKVGYNEGYTPGNTAGYAAGYAAGTTQSYKIKNLGWVAGSIGYGTLGSTTAYVSCDVVPTRIILESSNALAMMKHGHYNDDHDTSTMPAAYYDAANRRIVVYNLAASDGRVSVRPSVNVWVMYQ